MTQSPLRICLGFSLLLSLSVSGQPEFLDSLTERVEPVDWYPALAPDTTLFSLSFRKQKLDSLPVELRNFKGVKVLDLGRNRLTGLPVWLEELKQLEVIVLDRNNIDRWPEVLNRLPNLKAVVLNRNPLRALPASLPLCRNLRHLDLWDTDVEEIDAAVSELRLSWIDLRQTYLSESDRERLTALFPGAEIELTFSCKCSDK